MLTQKDLESIEKIVEVTVEGSITKAFKPVKKDTRRIKKDISYMIKIFDESDVKLSRRVGRIEEHLKFSPEKN